MRVGEIVSRIGDAVKIRNFVNNVMVELTVNIMILLFTVVLMLIYSWKLTLILLVAIPVYGILLFAFNRLNRKYQRKIMERSADLQAQLVESLDLIGTIRRFGIEDFTNVKTENHFIAMLRSIFAAAKGGLYVRGGIQIVEQSMVIAILWIGSSQVIDQNITPGTLMMFYSLVGYVTTPISSLISSNSTIQEALIVSDRLFQIMDLEQEEINNDKITLSTDMIGISVLTMSHFVMGHESSYLTILTSRFRKEGLLLSSVKVILVRRHLFHYCRISIRYKEGK